MRADSTAWLLDDEHPAVVWRVLVDLIRRPPEAPAVRRARGAASASEPLATLLAPLDPGGRWNLPGGAWEYPGGGGWRFVAAVQLGADPEDPRLDAAAGRLVEAEVPRTPGHPCIVARAAEALAGAGWSNTPVLTELLAWLEEELAEGGGWRCSEPSHRDERGRCVVTAAAVLGVLETPGARRRPSLAIRAREVVLAALGAGWQGSGGGWPNLLRTDRSELLLRLAMAGVPWDPRMAAALAGLQSAQDAQGRWAVEAGAEGRWDDPPQMDRPGQPSRWRTLHALVVLSTYAVAARLPRLFPERPA
ncbi:MAG TPA: hypothetical protein ENK19_03180 [Acidobacteria bacterium]|nr:hypothetical protein [Acidobacteriota bacterium]